MYLTLPFVYTTHYEQLLLKKLIVCLVNDWFILIQSATLPERNCRLDEIITHNVNSNTQSFKRIGVFKIVKISIPNFIEHILFLLFAI